MNRSYLNKPLFRLLWPPAYGAVVYLLILLLNNNLAQLNESFFGQELYFCVLLTYIVFESNRFVISVLLRDKNKDESTWTILNLFILTLFVTAIFIILGVNVYFKIVLGFSSWNIFSEELSIFLVVFIFSSILYTSIAVSNRYLYKENRNKLEQEKILKENLELELIRFKNEINPGLLYDSLESLISLVHKNAEEAENYIDKLAMLYRYILSSRNSELVKIKEDFKAAENMVGLLNEKHHNNVRVSNNIKPEHLDNLIIPGSLSAVVESIIRSTIITDHQPLHIMMESGNDGYLVVSHTLNDKLKVPQETDLSRLQRAYSVYTEKPVVSVKAFGENFIKIPLLQLKEEEEVA